jgi:serine/threonine-protein kinase
MLVGQQIGPFIVDKELGSGAMGTVFRGRYLKTGEVVAIKVMAAGLTVSNPTAAKRFELEWKILKQLRHPHIVRLFGHGSSHGVQYIAMEYVDGESLDKVMARRGRMSWETVVEIGQQLCNALQHAHEKGIIHRDLKPSNLMVLTSGTLKLTDFGIAKDLDVTQLTSANCTIGTAAYMSPEQCKGERILTAKSDLYSLGVVFYELITGRKPFNAENAMDMFLQHVQGEFPRPAHLVLDLPVWLDNLICGMLAKKPDDRPLDAKMVASILGSIRQKVEEQKSAGVELANARRMDVGPNNTSVTEADKHAARFLMKGKVRRRKKPNIQKPVWKKALALSVLLVGCLLTLIIRFWPDSRGPLYDRAVKRMHSSDADVRDNVRKEEVAEFLRRFGKDHEDPRVNELQDWADAYDIRVLEDLLQRHLTSRKSTSLLKVQPMGDEQEQAFKAVDREDDGKLEEAKPIWQTLREEGGGIMKKVAARHLADLEAVDILESQFKERRKRLAIEKEDKPFAEEGKQQAYIAWRADKFGDWALAHQRYKKLRSREGDGEEARVLRLLAAGKLFDRPAPGADPEVIQRERIARIKTTVEEATKLAPTNPGEASRLCLDVIALYGEEKEPEALVPLVQQARELQDKILGK